MQTLFDDLVELKDNYPMVKAAMIKAAADQPLVKSAAPGDPIDVKELTQQYGLPTLASLLAYLYATSQKDPSLPVVAGLPAAAFLGTRELQKSDTFKNLTLDSLLNAQWGGTKIMPLLAAAAIGYLVLDKMRSGKASIV